MAALTLRQAREESACVGVGVGPSRANPPLAWPLAVPQSAQKSCTFMCFEACQRYRHWDDEHKGETRLRPRLMGRTLHHRRGTPR
jgi:hypothetical protein